MSDNNHAAQGVLELHPKGYGFLRNPARNYVAQQADPYVPAPLVQKLHLREGLLLAGPLEPAKKGGPRLARIEHIEGEAPEKYSRRKFDDLTPIDPQKRIVLETLTSIVRAGADFVLTYHAGDAARWLKEGA